MFESDREASRSSSSHIKSIDITLAQIYLTELGLSIELCFPATSMQDT